MIDILSSIDGLDFDLTFKSKEQMLEDGVVLPMVSRQDLIFI